MEPQAGASSATGWSAFGFETAGDALPAADTVLAVSRTFEPLSPAVCLFPDSMYPLASEFNASHVVTLLLGLFSALHCVGMWGSIIGSLTLSLRRDIREQKARMLPFVLSYNLGRVCSYSLAGLFAGVLQHVLTFRLGQGIGYRLLQIASALVMAGAGFQIAGWFPRFAYIERVGTRLWRRIEPYGRRFLPVASLPQTFIFGAIWGWLPCGLVYAALALALAAAAGDIGRSALAMAAFGIGTLPPVVGMGLMTSLLVRLSGMNRFHQLTGITLVALALLAAFPWLNPMVRHGIHRRRRTRVRAGPGRFGSVATGCRSAAGQRIPVCCDHPGKTLLAQGLCP